MSAVAKKLPGQRRDYDRRKKRGPIRSKTVRPLWRQPMLLGLVVLLLGCGGAGGWWAWHEGWLVEARNRLDAVSRSIVGAITPFKLTDVTVEGRDYVERLARAHAEVSYTCHPGMIHLFYGLGAVIPYARTAFEQIGGEIRAALA